MDDGRVREVYIAAGAELRRRAAVKRATTHEPTE
jgi:hypothetical protein